MQLVLFAFAILSGSLSLNASNKDENTDAPIANEELRLAQLIECAILAGRLEADAAHLNERLSEDERRDAQSQFSMILIRADRCE